MQQLHKIDHSAIKVSQAVLILLNILAFIIDSHTIVLVTGILMVLGTILGKPAFGFVYQWLLKPAGSIKAEILLDNPEPHRFAQGLGSVFLAAASLALFNQAILLGWSLVWIVTALAALNLFAGFCVGCMVYYWLARMRLPGFSKAPPAGVYPGARPKTKVTHEP